ncbi:MAG TPA: tyrosine-type recombinase/integrase [Thermomicrobiales bacterium]|nr:tyrosine-type recombinase/integrase [Thermomicrobiales bacterium]
MAPGYRPRVVATHWEHVDPIFTGSAGRIPGRGDWFHHRDLVQRAGVSAIPIHSLRRTHATLAMAAGTHPRIVSGQLGHSSIRVTLNTYSHVSPDMTALAMERLSLPMFASPAATYTTTSRWKTMKTGRNLARILARFRPVFAS